MKKHFSIFFILLFPIWVFSQNVQVEGGLIAESLDVQTGQIKNVADPISAQDAATKAYVDAIKFSYNQDLLDAGLNGVMEDIDGNKYSTINLFKIEDFRKF